MAALNDYTGMSHVRRMKALKGALDRLAAEDPEAAKHAYVVGEDGPEIMVPETDGKIIPNPKSKNMPAGKRRKLDEMAEELGAPGRVVGGNVSGKDDKEKPVSLTTIPAGSMLEETVNSNKNIGGTALDGFVDSLSATRPAPSETQALAAQYEQLQKETGSRSPLENTRESARKSAEMGVSRTTPLDRIGTAPDVVSSASPADRFADAAPVAVESKTPSGGAVKTLDGSSLGNATDSAPAPGMSWLDRAAEDNIERRPGYTAADVNRQSALDHLAYETEGGKYAGGGLTAHGSVMDLTKDTDTGSMKRNALNADINKDVMAKDALRGKNRLDAFANSDKTDSENRRSDAMVSYETDRNNVAYQTGMAKAGATEAAGMARAGAMKEKNKLLADKEYSDALASHEKEKNAFKKQIMGDQSLGQNPDPDVLDFHSNSLSGGEPMSVNGKNGYGKRDAQGRLLSFKEFTPDSVAKIMAFQKTQEEQRKNGG